jgi:cystathionine beta-lyase family protein involved in aluminum resistance
MWVISTSDRNGNGHQTFVPQEVYNRSANSGLVHDQINSSTSEFPAAYQRMDLIHYGRVGYAPLSNQMADSIRMIPFQDRNGRVILGLA